MNQYITALPRLLINAGLTANCTANAHCFPITDQDWGNFRSGRIDACTLYSSSAYGNNNAEPMTNTASYADAINIQVP